MVLCTCKIAYLTRHCLPEYILKFDNLFQSLIWAGMAKIGEGVGGVEGGGEVEEEEEEGEVGRRGDLRLLLQTQTVLYR